MRRDGAFALANGGTLFLDEVGELPLTLQAQLLRVIQEHQFKRVGSNTWQRTEFRLVCATNRDLLAGVAEGRFRADLYHRLAGWVCHVPPLRDRPEDILPLTTHFLSQLNHAPEPVVLDRAVQEYLVSRDYPGNVRELRQLVTRMWYRHTGPGAITPGDIPKTDRPVEHASRDRLAGRPLRAGDSSRLDRGAGLKEIGRAAAETAIRIALEQEQDNVHRACDADSASPTARSSCVVAGHPPAALIAYRAPSRSVRRRKFSPVTSASSSGDSSQRANLRELDRRMQPRTIGSEQHFARAGALHSLLEEIEAAHTGRVGIDVGMARDEIDQRELRPPVVGKAPEVRDDEGDIGVFLRQELGGGRSPPSRRTAPAERTRGQPRTLRA